MKEWSVTIARLGLKEGAMVCPLANNFPQNLGCLLEVGGSGGGRTWPVSQWEGSVVFFPTVVTVVLVRMSEL